MLIRKTSMMRFIAMELLSLVICGMQLKSSGAQRCVTNGALCEGSKHCQANRDGSQSLTLNGRILSYESGCNAPLDSARVRLYIGCVNSVFYDAEPIAEWKTDRNGAFEVKVPYKHDQTGVVRAEVCLEPRRACQPVTVAILGVKSASVLAPKPVAATASKPISVSAAKPVSMHDIGGDAFDYTASMSVCIEEKGKRRRRSTGLDDLGINWLERGLRQEARAKETGKRGWSNGIPWLKRIQGKRLWEGADEEVGWIKREDHQDPHEGLIGGTGSNDTEDSQSGGQPPKPPRSQQRSLSNERQLTVPRQRTLSKMAAWPQPAEIKKYWAESDMSWL